MHKKYNKFLIVSFLIVCVLGVYSYFYNDLKSEAAMDDEEALSSSLDNTTNNVAPNPAGKATEDTAFLMKLASLNKIKIDTSIFTDQSFQILVDNNIKFEPVPYGRVNPFSPVAGQVVSTSIAENNSIINTPVLPNTPLKTVKTSN